MIPLKDDIPCRRTPFVTLALIAMGIGVFAWQITGAPSFRDSIYLLGLRPALLLGDDPLLQARAFASLFTSMFAHGSFLHLGSNLLFLWIFGNNVEDVMGRGRFVAFYLLCGVAAAGAQIVSHPASDIPMVGASGAIAGVLGAYFLLFPRARVLTLVPIFVFLRLVWLPAVFFLGIWFFFQIIGGLGSGEGPGVAFWAHVGGFVAGLVLVKPFAGRLNRPGSRRFHADPWGSNRWRF